MADNTTLPGTGDVIAADDIGGVKYQRVKVVYGPDGTNTGDADVGNPFPMQQAATYFIAGAGNTSTAQLAAGATFTGTIENTLSQQSVSLLINSDQAITITLNQYIDAAGTYNVSSAVFNVAANVDFAQSFTLNANYFNLTVKNNGASATTTLNINTYYGTIPPAGQQPMSSSMPVVIASNQSTVNVTSDTQAKSTYTATLARVATGALTANTLKAVMSFEHAAGATKKVILRSLKVSGYATTAVAGTCEFQLARGTAASSGGTGVTPTPCLPGVAAAETTVKSLPTITAATVVGAWSATSVPATANSTIGSSFELLYDAALDSAQDFTLRAANLDTLVLSIISTGAINVTLNVTAVFTEE